MKKVISLFLVLSLLLTSVSTVFAENRKVKLDDFNNEEDISAFKPAEMSEKELEVYYSAIEREVNAMKVKHGRSFDEKTFRKELISLLETETNFVSLKDNYILNDNYMMTRDGTWIPDIKIKNNVVEGAINVIISVVIGGVGVGSLSAYVRKVGLKEARRIFTKTIATKLKAWGLGVLAASSVKVFDFMVNYLNPGYYAANFLDSIDSYPNNGYLDVIL